MDLSLDWQTIRIISIVSIARMRFYKKRKKIVMIPERIDPKTLEGFPKNEDEIRCSCGSPDIVCHMTFLDIGYIASLCEKCKDEQWKYREKIYNSPEQVELRNQLKKNKSMNKEMSDKEYGVI